MVPLTVKWPLLGRTPGTIMHSKPCLPPPRVDFWQSGQIPLPARHPRVVRTCFLYETTPFLGSGLEFLNIKQEICERFFSPTLYYAFKLLFGMKAFFSNT